MIYIAGISIALFNAALLLNKKAKSKSDIFLLFWMLLIAINLFFFHINYTGKVYKWPFLLGLEHPIPLLHGVFLYFYVSSITNQFPKKSWIIYLHLIPIVLGYIYLLLLFQSSNTTRVELLASNNTGYRVFLTLGLILIFLSGVIYVVWSSILLIKHKKNIRNQFSDVEEINLKWLQFLTFGLGIIWCIVIFTNNDEYIFTGVSIFAILIGFYGVQQKTIFTNKNIVLVKPLEKVSRTGHKKEKYAKSGLTDDIAEDLYKNLLLLITEKNFYKRNDLSLNDLASELNIHPNYLSQLINEKEEKSFYDFINAFRVEEFKRLVKIPENKEFTLLALAYDCGFNSKSSFNRYFKKHTSKTPSQYVKSL